MLILPPIIERELRVQARARGTYWLRSLAGGGAALVFAWTVLLQRIQLGPLLGPWLFTRLHLAIMLFLAVTCPLMSAETLARERRDGTLGLLLLTPLRPRDVVLGKIAVHLLRAFTLWAAIVPVLAVPILIGGVGLATLGAALSLEMTVVFGGLAAGLLASCHADRWGAVMALAALFAGLVGLALWGMVIVIFGLPVWLANSHHPMPNWTAFVVAGATAPFVNGFQLVGGRALAGWMLVPLGRMFSVRVVLVAYVASSLALLLIACWIASRHVRRYGQYRQRSARQEAWGRFWLQPLAKRRHAFSRRLLMRRNPLLWLYTLRPVLRLNRWGWCALVSVVWAVLSISWLREPEIAWWTLAIPVVLTAILVFVAAAAFRREMAEGTLELLLVTPLRPQSILQARIYSFWLDFFPGLALASGLALLESNWHGNIEGAIFVLVIVWSSFAATPFVAVRFAIRRVNLVSAWLWTVGLTVFFPLLFSAMLGFVASSGENWRWFTALAFIGVQGTLGGFAAWATMTDLVTRRFQLKPLQRVVA